MLLQGNKSSILPQLWENKFNSTLKKKKKIKKGLILLKLQENKFNYSSTL